MQIAWQQVQAGHTRQAHAGAYMQQEQHCVLCKLGSITITIDAGWTEGDVQCRVSCNLDNEIGLVCADKHIHKKCHHLYIARPLTKTVWIVPSQQYAEL